MRLGLDFLFSYQGITSDMLIWGAFVAVSLASLFAYADRRGRGALVRALIGGGALDAQHAMTLAEAGCAKNLFVRAALARRGSTLSSLTAAAEEEASIGGEGLPPRSSRHYYLPEQTLPKAKALYGTAGSGFGTVLLTILLFLVLALLAINLTEPFLSFAAWAFGRQA